MFPKEETTKPLQHVAKIGLLHAKDKAIGEVSSSVLAEMCVPVDTGKGASHNGSKKVLVGASRGLTIRSS